MPFKATSNNNLQLSKTSLSLHGLPLTHKKLLHFSLALASETFFFFAGVVTVTMTDERNKPSLEKHSLAAKKLQCVIAQRS